MFGSDIIITEADRFFPRDLHTFFTLSVNIPFTIYLQILFSSM